MRLRFNIFENYPSLVVLMSNKEQGSMRLNEDDYEVLDRRSRFLISEGWVDASMSASRLVHGTNVEGVSSSDQVLEGTDGLISNEPGHFLAISVADCFPVFMYDPLNGALGVMHSGWKGTHGGISENGIKAMKNIYGTNPSSVVCGIGPGICPHHYEVGKDLVRMFDGYDAIDNINGRLHLDLAKVISLQLQRSGVRTSNIEIHEDCTYCRKDLYFSYRRDRPKVPQCMLTGIILCKS